MGPVKSSIRPTGECIDCDVLNCIFIFFIQLFLLKEMSVSTLDRKNVYFFIGKLFL